MNRQNPQTQPVPVSPELYAKTILSEQDLRRLMIAQIASGMFGNSRYRKFNSEQIINMAIECTNKILQLT